MALTLKDVKTVTAGLPHPRDWKVNRMESEYICEDGVSRRFSFEFKFVDATTLAEREKEQEIDEAHEEFDC